MDVVSGTYMGRIIAYYGGEQGFAPQVDLEQKTNLADRAKAHDYMYANPTFADYNGDGLLDAFVVGYKGVNVMINEGSKEKPLFAIRKPLLHVDGQPIFIRDLTTAEIKNSARTKRESDYPEAKSSVTFVDWDRDGVEDLIIATTNQFTATPPVMFFKGVKGEDGVRFEKGVGLFAAEDNTHAIRGKNFYVWVGDYNEDGISDLMLGVTFPYYVQERLFDTKPNAVAIAELKQQKVNPKNVGCVILMLGEGFFE